MATKKKVVRKTRSQQIIEDEIEWYQPLSATRRIMRDLGKMGFEFSGHGAGCGGEDFGLTYELSKDSYLYAEVSEMGRKVKTSLTLWNGDDAQDLDGNLYRTARKIIKAAKKN